MKVILMIAFSLSLIWSPVALSQDGGNNANLVEDTKRDLLIITGVGLGGALIGLSTLSFVDEPSDHYDNVVVGGSIGIIIGVIVVASLQAERSGEYLGKVPSSKDFLTKERLTWHGESFKKNQSFLSNKAVDLSFSF